MTILSFHSQHFLYLAYLLYLPSNWQKIQQQLDNSPEQFQTLSTQVMNQHESTITPRHLKPLWYHQRSPLSAVPRLREAQQRHWSPDEITVTSALRHAQRDQRGGWLAAEKVVSELRWARVVPNEMMKTVQETLRSKGDFISK